MMAGTARARQIESFCRRIRWDEEQDFELLSANPLVLKTANRPKWSGPAAEAVVELILLHQNDRDEESSAPVRMLRSNLRDVLLIAIRYQGLQERMLHGPDFESCAVAGWKEILAAIDDGREVVVRDE